VSPSARPAVLFLTHHLPWPARSGGRLREAQLLQRLSARFDIEVVAVSKVPELDCRHVEDATRHGVRARVFAAQAGGDHNAGPLTRRHAAPAARDYLAHRLRRSPVVVHVEGHYLLGLVPERVRPAVLLVEHNIESALFDQRAAYCTAPAERAHLLREGTRTCTDEVSAWRQVRIVGAVTEEDALAIRTAVPDADVRCLPNGADHLSTESYPLDEAQRAAARLLFVGDLRYEPNLHAARLLLEDIYPQILRRYPDVTLAIVGSDPPQWLVNAASRSPSLTVTGWVPDVAPWLDAARVVVCPLTIGGGVKVKVLEALARGCAIVATPIALQGLRHLLPGAALERCDAHSIADACAHLLTCPQERDRQRARAADAAQHLPSWDLAADTLANTWNELAATAAEATNARA
jgi:polysaccharide biosynthesis protein PslH